MLCEYAVDKSVLKCLLSSHKIISVGVLFNLLNRLSRIFGKDSVEHIACTEYLKLKVDKNGKVISVSVDKSKSNISDPTTINAIVEAIKTRAKYDAGESEMMVEVKYVCKQKS